MVSGSVERRVVLGIGVTGDRVLPCRGSLLGTPDLKRRYGDTGFEKNLEQIKSRNE